jgi:hypothetical protein
MFPRKVSDQGTSRWQRLRKAAVRLKPVAARAKPLAARAKPLAKSTRSVAKRQMHKTRAWAAPRVERTGHALQETVAPKVSALLTSAAQRIEPNGRAADGHGESGTDDREHTIQA